MYSIPTQSRKKYYRIDSFKGVDFTSSELDVDKGRSPNAKNIINNNGFIESRTGYKKINKIGNKINGVWNIDTPVEELFLIHSGTCLYQTSTDFSESVLVLNGMSDNRSKGIYINGYLLIFDGTRTVVFSKFDGTNYEAKFLDKCGYIPLTSIARDVSGGGTDYEKFNMLSPYAMNSFLASKIETGLDDEGNPTYKNQDIFKLDKTNIVDIISVKVLKDDATWEEKIKNTDYTYSLEKGEIYFSPGESPVLGRDNVEITYKYDNSTEKNKINSCTIAELYGYESNNNRIFASGNKNFPNYDFWCEQDNPLYWPDENFAKIGTEPIVSYSKLNDGTLAIHKKHSDTDNTIYYRSYNLLDSVEVFPLKSGSKNIGCISGFSNANLTNDPLILTNEGVYAIIGSSYQEKFAMQRSYYVDGKLLKENNLESAIGIVVNGKYYLGVNNHVYVADSRYKVYPKNANTEQYQYEWYYWDNIPARVFFAWNNKLYFGTEDGYICSFSENYKDVDTPVECYWETPYLDMGTTQYAKTIKTVTLILNPDTNINIIFSYLTDDGETNIISKLFENSSFAKTINEKEKISKFMFVKFIMKNNTDNKMSFEKFGCEFIIAGRYKGE